MMQAGWWDALLKLSDDYGVLDPHGVRINYPVTYEHLADITDRNLLFEIKSAREAKECRHDKHASNMDFIMGTEALKAVPCLS